MLAGIRGVLFDKDGTLFDFSESWSGWAAGLLEDLSAGDEGRASAMAAAIGFDRAAGRFEPTSPVIAGTLDEAAMCLGGHLPELSHAELTRYLLESAVRAEMVAPVQLGPFLRELRLRQFALGVATNDAEAAARAHLTRAGVLAEFTAVLGYDSGFTPKPAPDMLLEFAARAGLAPAQVVMVGDSTHDLIAGRAAGMVTVGVLTGMAPAEVLSPHADLVLPHIGHLTEHL